MADSDEKAGSQPRDELRGDGQTLRGSYRRGRRSYVLVYLFGLVVVFALVAYAGLRDRTSGASAPLSAVTRAP